jgi:hypothetical protein
MKANTDAAIDADAERLIAIFEDIHQNPELAFMEVRTGGIVADELEALGCEVKTGIGKTDVVGIMRNGDGPVVMYRGDMDCNAVEEATGLSYASTKTATRKDADGKDAHSWEGRRCPQRRFVDFPLGSNLCRDRGPRRAHNQRMDDDDARLELLPGTDPRAARPTGAAQPRHAARLSRPK